ncbi:hypothetical protein HJC23_005844 [Cyclotella cryptica]|uniref:Uncharacterized protein n=1 Tax=Cyclotella cryptica TaxID=29204 RepID=A0ABD3QYV1_9STRA
MSQRLLASHSAMITKGVALKAGDWRNPDASDVGLQNSKMLRRSESVASMTSLQKQFNVQRPSSSILASSSMIKSRSYSALQNALCDGKENRKSFPTRPDRSRPGLIDLVPVKTDATSRHALKFSKETSRHTIRSRPSMPNLSSLAEEKAEEESFKTVSQRLSSLLDVTTYEMDYAFKILPPDIRNKPTSPESTSCIAKDVSSYYIRSRLSVPNLSSLVEEEEEEVSLKKCTSSSTQNNTKDVIVDTFKQKVPKKLNIQDISMTDLDSLKMDDPFMYYSIPAVKNTAWNGEHGDPQSLHDSVLSPRDSSVYERKSRISFECWNLTSPSDAGVDDMDGYFIPSLGDAFFDFSMDDDEDDEDPIDDFLLMSYASVVGQSSGR